MGVFSSIKDFLFGKKFITVGKSGQAQAAPSTAAPRAATPAAQTQPVPTAQPANVGVAERVDIEAILDQEAREAGQTLNWRQSIVDLMKLCGIDSSLQNRKELAQELGYTGDMNDSATMNIWLHKAVMRELEKSGGQVPANLKD
jgi:hypothetical protein